MTFDRNEFRQEVGKRIAYYRRSRCPGQWNQQWLADVLGISRGSVANIETGRQAVTIDRLWRIAIELRVPIGKLIPERITSRGTP